MFDERPPAPWHEEPGPWSDPEWLHFDGIEPQRFVVPLYVEAYSHEGPVPVAKVAKYLSDASRLYLNTTDHGNGPSGSLTSV